MLKCFFKPLLQVYVLQKLLKVKIIKPQFFTTLDLLLSALNIHNLKMAFNLALNFSGWCILIFFFLNQRQAELFTNMTWVICFLRGAAGGWKVFFELYWLPTTLLKIWGISWAIPISSVTSNFPPFLCDTSDIYQ